MKFKDILKSIGAFFVMLFGNAEKVEDWMISHADEGIEKGQFVRDLVKGPLPDLIKAVTPDFVDKIIDKYRADVIEKIDKVIAEMQNTSICLHLSTPAERIACYVNEVRGMSAKRQNGEIYKFASSYTQLSAADANKEVKESVADTAVQTRLMAKKIDLGIAA